MRKLLPAIISLVFVAVAPFVSPVWAVPGEYQQCTIGTDCTIGEFLYDDEYSPITSASCTLTSRDPDGNLFLNSVSMAVASDGWYSYDVTTTGEDAGIYRSQICCTSGSDYLCIDKTFEIVSASAGSSLTAADVWDYSSRSLTDFGSLADAVWNRGVRTLTGAGISGNNLATQGSNGGADLTTLNTSIENIAASIANLSGQVSQNQSLIEDLDQQVTNNYLTTISNETIESLSISSSELTTISNEANEIVSLLEGTEYYDEAVSITEEINSSIENINNLQDSAVDDPEAVIENYRETTSELASIIANLGKLQSLMEESNSAQLATGSSGGFMSSAPSWVRVASIGLLLLLIIVALIFLFAYIRILLIKQSRSLKVRRASLEKKLHPDHKDGKPHAPLSPILPHRTVGWPRFFFIVLVTGSVSALISGGLIVGLSRSEGKSKKYEPEAIEVAAEPEVEGVFDEAEQVASDSSEIKDKEARETEKLEKQDTPSTLSLDQDKVRVYEGSRANIRVEPMIGARIIDQLSRGHLFVPLEETPSWVRIRFEIQGEVKEGWIFKELVSY